MSFPTSVWPLRQLELWVMCQATGIDRLPTPLTFHTDIEHTTDFDQAARLATQDLLGRFRGNDELERAVTLLARPWVQIQIVGTAFVAGGENYSNGISANSVVRVFAGIDSGAGAVAVQAPGPGEEIGGDILLSLDEPGQVAHRIVDALPRARPGSRPGFGFRKTDIAPPAEFASPASWRPSSTPSQSASPRQMIRAFRNRPIDRIIEVTVSPGAAKGGIPNAGRTFRLVEFTDDGTYLVRDTTTNVTVAPATPAAVAEETDRHLRGYLNAARNIPT